MKARDFAFWLQGYFEILSTDAPLTIAQGRQVAEKLEQVDDTSDDKVGKFAEFARGLMAAVQSLPGEPQKEAALQGITPMLRKALNDVFLHAIDPTIKGEQQQLRRTHRPNDKDTPPGGGLVAMC